MRNDDRVRPSRPGARAWPTTILTPAVSEQQRPDGGQYDFLVGSVIDEPTLRRASAEAARCGVTTHEALLAMGWLSARDYASALARSLGVPMAGWDAALDLRTAAEASDLDGMGLPARIAGRPCRVLCAESGTPDSLRRQAAVLRSRGLNVALATRSSIDAAVEPHLQPQRMDLAVRGLYRWHPVASAGGVLVWTWQLVAAAVAAGLVIGGFTTAPEATIAVLSAVAALPFLCVILLRVVALREILLARRNRSRRKPAAVATLGDRQLPYYSVLVPLFREAGVLPDLVQSLDALDYPRAKLEILLVLEEADIDTQAAVLELRLPPPFRTVIVPEGDLRTKPKALNYALQLARGEYVVVYDAEDRPQPDQLRRALEAFRRGPPDLGCLQARLNVYNPRASWLTRQFTVEYSALFDAILPALARLGLPVPLGGTSNHFRRDTLVAAGGWDPFNMTEDADLGFRLARQGWRTMVLASTTWEEAPVSFGGWFRQRTRWLKGWRQPQTYQRFWGCSDAAGAGREGAGAPPRQLRRGLARAQPRPHLP